MVAWPEHKVHIQMQHRKTGGWHQVGQEVLVPASCAPVLHVNTDGFQGSNGVGAAGRTGERPGMIPS